MQHGFLFSNRVCYELYTQSTKSTYTHDFYEIEKDVVRNWKMRCWRHLPSSMFKEQNEFKNSITEKLLKKKKK